MTSSLQIIVSLLAVFGIGGIIGAYFQALFERQRRVKEEEHELKLRRYGCILILMLTQLNPETGMRHVHEIRPDLQSLNDVEEEIKTELLNSVLFANDGVIRSLAEFVRRPSYPSYIKVAVSMRKDLWGRKTAISEGIFDIFKKGMK